MPSRDRLRLWLLQLLLAVDQLVNAVLGGWADETISSRAWRLSGTARRWELARVLIEALFRLFGQRAHCFDAWVAERLRLQMPPELRDGWLQASTALERLSRLP